VRLEFGTHRSPCQPPTNADAPKGATAIDGLLSVTLGMATEGGGQTEDAVKWSSRSKKAEIAGENRIGRSSLFRAVRLS